MTKYPCSIRIGDLLFFDLPGLRDTGGMTNDMVNAAFIKAILEKASSVRLVIFASENEVEATRGEPLKKLLDGVRKMFDANSGVLEDSSILIITKSEQDDISELADLLKDSVPESYHPMLENWINTGRLFQVKKPEKKVICHDGKAEIMKALSQIGMKVPRVNISAVYPETVDRELGDVIIYFLEEAYNSFMPKPNEKLLSSLLSAIDTVKGDINSDDYIAEFWLRFESHVHALPVLNVLSPLSESVFSSVQERFQSVKSEAVKSTVDRWESRYDLLSTEIQNKLVTRIDAICRRQGRLLRDKYLFSDIIPDVASGEAVLHKYQDALKTDVKEVVLKAVNDDPEIIGIVELDSERNKVLLNEAKNRFSQTVLQELTDEIHKGIESSIKLVRTQTEKLRLESSVRLKLDEMSRLSDEVEKERKEKEKLKNEIALINTQASAALEQIRVLRLAVKNEREAREKAEAERSAQIARADQNHAAISRLSKQVEEEKMEKEKLRSEIASLHSQSASSQQQIKLLQVAVAREREAREKAEANRTTVKPAADEFAACLFPQFPQVNPPASTGKKPAADEFDCLFTKVNRPASTGKMTWEQAYRLYQRGGYTQQDIAKMMGCAQSTVSRHFSRM